MGYMPKRGLDVNKCEIARYAPPQVFLYCIFSPFFNENYDAGGHDSVCCKTQVYCYRLCFITTVVIMVVSYVS